MTVYVDDMRAKFGRMIMCHMIADDELELHGMASKIGIRYKWYQGDHYDICLQKRALAISLGAKEITQRQCALMCRASMFRKRDAAIDAARVKETGDG